MPAATAGFDCARGAALDRADAASPAAFVRSGAAARLDGAGLVAAERTAAVERVVAVVPGTACFDPVVLVDLFALAGASSFLVVLAAFARARVSGARVSGPAGPCLDGRAAARRPAASAILPLQGFRRLSYTSARPTPGLSPRSVNRAEGPNRYTAVKGL